jgi:tRNA pseudouridine38-40 synthase
VTLFDPSVEPVPKPTAPPSGPGSRLKLVVAYDGTDFHGFAAQTPDIRTVEATLANALEKVLRAQREFLNLACAGRTDAGVHARGQVVTVDAPPDADADKVAHAVNRMIGPEIVVRECKRVAAEFDARRSATSRTYRYTILNRSAPDPFLARTAWWVPEPLDLAQLRLAADPFVGEHDFASFCRRGPSGTTMTRHVLEAHWLPVDDDGVYVFEITASAFCWQMVRSIVGTIVDAGSGKRRPGEMLSILRARDRQAAGTVAPPQGLTLWEVAY